LYGGVGVAEGETDGTGVGELGVGVGEAGADWPSPSAGSAEKIKVASATRNGETDVIHPPSWNEARAVVLRGNSEASSRRFQRR
jgi:hypothetical protein